MENDTGNGALADAPEGANADEPASDETKPDDESDSEPTDDQWAQWLSAAAVSSKPKTAEHPKATTFRESYGGASAARRVTCDDGADYVLKNRAADVHGAVADHIAGRLANLLGSPVPETVLVDVPQELIDNEPQMSGFQAGLAHGSKYIKDCGPRGEATKTLSLDMNKKRAADLAVFYGFGIGDDFQLFYENQTSRVWSFDHGRFFPGSSGWSAASLANAAEGQPHQKIMNDAGITNESLQSALADVGKLSHMQIAEVVAAVPADWPTTQDDRLAMAKFLSRRRRDLLRFVAKATE